MLQKEASAPLAAATARPARNGARSGATNGDASRPADTRSDDTRPDDTRPDDRAVRAAAGREALDWQRILGKSKSNVVAEVLRHQGQFYQWNHYPKGDVYDPASRSQWYYHAHPKDQRPGEHGHFHTFRRTDDKPAHLIGISMDKFGKPIQLFTTNRWVTGERWRPAAELVPALDRFDIELAHPSWPVNRWLVAVLRCYRPVIAELLEERDRTIERWRAEHPDADVLEDKRLEVTSSLDIDLERDTGRLEAAA